MSFTGGESWTPFVAADVVVVVDSVAAVAAVAPSLHGLERRKAARAVVRPIAYRRVVTDFGGGEGGCWKRQEHEGNGGNTR
jgi:hypothetical protein